MGYVCVCACVDRKPYCFPNGEGSKKMQSKNIKWIKTLLKQSVEKTIG